MLPSFWKPWEITTAIARPDPAAYLRVSAYRTIDLRIALGAILPAWVRLGHARSAARRGGREANVKSLLDQTRTRILPNTLDHTQIVLVVQFIKDNTNATTVANALFKIWPNLLHYIAITDGPPRLLVIKRDDQLQTFAELDQLPSDLPYARTGGALGLDLLAWSPTPEMLNAIRAVATTPLALVA